MSNIEKIENSTKSILLYISSEEGKEVVKKYFKNVSRRGLSDPNYSDMIEVLDLWTGTTEDGVQFGSAFVDRSKITSYLRESYCSAS